MLIWRWGLIASAMVALSPTGAGAAPEPSNTQADWYAGYHRDSRMVNLSDERRLAIYCMGSGSPTVVLESGLGDGASSWWPIQAEVAKATRVCAYDRAGMGRSPAGPKPRDTRAEVEDLELLLKNADLAPPYVLVGHSMGAYNVRLYASRHPEAVAGIVLVDGSVENQGKRFSAVAPDWAKLSNRNLDLLKRCAEPNRSAAVADACVGSPPPGYPEDYLYRFREAESAAHFAAVLSERESFDTLDSTEVIAERRPFGAKPLIVLTAGAGIAVPGFTPEQVSGVSAVWSRMHDEVAALSTAGVNRTVAGAHHYIHGEKPEAVIAAVVEVVEAARKQR
jgi:pimeloyl-ACP methyl ester carboxylesterase